MIDAWRIDWQQECDLIGCKYSPDEKRQNHELGQRWWQLKRGQLHKVFQRHTCLHDALNVGGRDKAVGRSCLAHWDSDGTFTGHGSQGDGVWRKNHVPRACFHVLTMNWKCSSNLSICHQGNIFLKCGNSCSLWWGGDSDGECNDYQIV